MTHFEINVCLTLGCLATALGFWLVFTNEHGWGRVAGFVALGIGAFFAVYVLSNNKWPKMPWQK